ncbi:MAG: hypothetical protein HYW27_03375 [Candidatus Aenigmarchaeota archaeon]|nr:hypothetical protein [Candidatus Aenigmarchaeota archaeon]
MHSSAPDDFRVHFAEGMLHVVGPEAERLWKRPTTLQYGAAYDKAGHFTDYSYYLGPREIIEILYGRMFSLRYKELNERDEARRTLFGGLIVRRTYDHSKRAKFSRKEYKAIMEHYEAAALAEAHRES